MFLAISKFKVKNNMQQQVSHAFQNRPHLVDDIEGFQSMEVFVPKDDETEFWLLTRWTNESSFLKWHNSDAHHQSHKGIPKGLKLDSKATMVRYFERIAD